MDGYNRSRNNWRKYPSKRNLGIKGRPRMIEKDIWWFLMVQARVLLLIKEDMSRSRLWRALYQDRRMEEKGINMCFSLSLTSHCPNNVLYNCILEVRSYTWRDSLCVTVWHSSGSEGGRSARADHACLRSLRWTLRILRTRKRLKSIVEHMVRWNMLLIADYITST